MNSTVYMDSLETTVDECFAERDQALAVELGTEISCKRLEIRKYEYQLQQYLPFQTATLKAKLKL